ncbi:hypothetical protein KC19_8G053800 [Ceratodon purpureus]|uniref:Uncharacterized protein n=1 Tax=Ceratodon purpureus TaxID=3225 RepID=A0A8T0GYS0_CERPU|nr:hypothetical protein KC19_8G053800 [Ceratodon purpureus]
MRRHGVVRYLTSVLPVPQLDYSADAIFGCDGTESFGKVFAMEILATHMRAPGTRVDIEEELDIICPSWIAEKFLGQLLPRALPRYGVGCLVDFPSPVEACAWLEDMETHPRIVVREIEAYVQDLPDSWRFSERLHRDILRRYFNFAKEFECVKLECSTKPQIQYVIEPGPYAIPLSRDEGWDSLLQTLLDDAVSNLENAEAVHQNGVKTFELKTLDQDSLWEQHSGQSRHRELEEYTKTIDIQNLVGRVHGSRVEEPVTKLLDFDPADFLLEKLHIREDVVQHKLRSARSALNVVGGLSLLDENSVSTDVSIGTKHAMMDYTTMIMFELPEVLEDEHLDSILTLKIGTYVRTLMKPNPVELEDLESREIASQDFEKLVVLPELNLETSRFHFLRVPSFVSEQQIRIPEDVFMVIFRAKALPSSTSASDWVYLDWHLSQVGHCNNYGCFHLQRRMLENELHVTVQRDISLAQRMPDHLLLLSLADGSLPDHHAETQCGNNTKEVYSAAYIHASVSNPVLNFSSSVYKVAKAADKNLPDQSLLTDDPRNNFPLARDQVPLAVSGSTSMDSVLSLVKQARQGDTESMQASVNEIYQEGYQGIDNTRNQSHDQTPEVYQVFDSASIAVKNPTPNPPSSSDIDATWSRNLQFSNHVEQELQVPVYTPACHFKELPQMGIKPAPPLQPAYEELRLQQSELDNILQLSGGQGQGPHLIVVANILQPSGSIFLQRRSSYQKILGLENEDLQVVEREMKLPVDLILNPSTCLTVYTKDKLLQCAKSRSPDSEEFLSCVMDMIVDCHMKALSFSFQKWFMIFEELGSNSTIIRILNKLYICSAAFQMRVQGFISPNPIATDSLVLRCIKKTWKISKRPFDSPMAEDMTEGEIYLATFPSLNPLSSHAILCLNVTVAKFISWSNEEQNCALQDFNVRAESLNLLTAQVLYGKLVTSGQRETFSECPWPAASEIVAPEVERHVQAGFTHFPPASEITGCELEDPDGVPPREAHSDLYPPSCPDPILPYDSGEQGISTWNGACRSNDDDEPATFAHHANDRSQQPDCLEETYGCYNPVNVTGILQQWIRKRKGGDRGVNHSGVESKSYYDSLQVPNNESYRERPCVNRFSSSVECTNNTVHPTYKHEAKSELWWASLPKTSGKRPISALEQYRHQRGLSLALQSHKKKLKPAVPSNRSQDHGPSSQLDHSLKISRQSCYKFNAPFGRTI